MDKLAALLATASPALATALNGPYSALALAALGRAVVQDEEATPEQIAAALSAGDPEAELKVRDAESEFLHSSRQTSVELARIAAQARAHSENTLHQLEAEAARDRASARQRQMEMNDQTNKWLAYAVTLGFFVVLLSLLGLSAFDRELKGSAVLYTMLGMLGTGWTGVIAFYFGSSVGSKEKSAILAESATPPKRLDT